MEQVERQIGQKPPELVEPNPFPPAGDFVWSVFCALSNRRTPGFSGVSPISFRDIKDYKDLLECRLRPWEVDLIIKLDNAYLEVANG